MRATQEFHKNWATVKSIDSTVIVPESSVNILIHKLVPYKLKSLLKFQSAVEEELHWQIIV